MSVVEFERGREEVLARLRAAGVNEDAIASAVALADERPPGDSAAGARMTTPFTTSLEFLSVRELAEQVRLAGPPRFLLRGLWPAGDYGIHSAPAKAQKTWTTVDAAVSVASGTPFLGHVPVDTTGPVVILAGEGGARNLLRRLRATAEAHYLDAVEDLPITVTTRAPHLDDDLHLADMRAVVEAVEPALVCLDPLYLAAGGANLADLYGMGKLLERVQHVCADAGAALWVTTHHNRKDGRGAGRILGAGPAEWGRVLITGEVQARHTHPVDKSTDTVIDLDVIGGEVADQSIRLRRRIWSDNPDDLSADLHLEVSVEAAPEPSSEAGATADLPPAARKILEALTETGPATSTAIVDEIARQHGHGLRRETMSRTLADLERRGMVRSTAERPFDPKTWSLADA